MGSNNSIISVMFEEIKSIFTSIDLKLNERVTAKENQSSSATATEPKPDVKPNMIKPEQLLQLIAAHFQESERKIGQFTKTVRESEKYVLSQLDELKQITVSQKPDS
jgi:hypothetical protein